MLGVERQGYLGEGQPRLGDLGGGSVLPRGDVWLPSTNGNSGWILLKKSLSRIHSFANSAILGVI
jgi:hypothetical protein